MYSQGTSHSLASMANNNLSGGSIHASRLVTLTNGKHELSWSFQSSLKSQVTKENPEDVKPLASSPLNDSKANASQAETKRTLSNLSSAVVYKGVRQDVDLQYILQSNQVKENILLHKLPDNN